MERYVTKMREKKEVRPHLSSMMSLQEEVMMHPADEAMTAWMDDTRLRGQKESDEQLDLSALIQKIVNKSRICYLISVPNTGWRAFI